MWWELLIETGPPLTFRFIARDVVSPTPSQKLFKHAPKSILAHEACGLRGKRLPSVVSKYCMTTSNTYLLLLLLLQRSTGVHVRSSARLMPQNQPSDRDLLPSPTAWSPDEQPRGHASWRHGLFRAGLKDVVGVRSACLHSHREVSETPILFRWALRQQCTVRRRKIVVCWAKVCLVSSVFFLAVSSVPGMAEVSWPLCRWQDSVSADPGCRFLQVCSFVSRQSNVHRHPLERYWMFSSLLGKGGGPGSSGLHQLSWGLVGLTGRWRYFPFFTL